jgi:translation initiation factor 2 subunit 1
MPSELVILQVAKVMPFGAYCKLLEYNNVEVFLPIKEVSSGWIKNIHEFVHEGQKLVCKVTYIDKERGTIDVSLKKVTAKETRQKNDSYNLERRLQAMFTRAVRTAGLESQKEELIKKAVEEFTTYTNLMRNVGGDSAELEKSKLPKKLRSALLELLESSKKKKRYVVSYIMKLTSYDTKKGVTELKEVIGAIKDIGVEVTYISAPSYRLVSEGKDYVDAEKKIRQASDYVQERLKNGLFELDKEKLKKEKEDIMSAL